MEGAPLPAKYEWPSSSGSLFLRGRIRSHELSFLGARMSRSQTTACHCWEELVFVLVHAPVWPAGKSRAVKWKKVGCQILAKITWLFGTVPARWVAQLD